MKELKVSSFIAGYSDLYNVVRDYPDLRMVPINYVDAVRTGLKSLGYNFRIRYRGPRLGRNDKDTLKRHARAFTIYFRDLEPA